MPAVYAGRGWGQGLGSALSPGLHDMAHGLQGVYAVRTNHVVLNTSLDKPGSSIGVRAPSFASGWT